MITDALGIVTNAQHVTGTALSTNTFDDGNVTPKRAIGSGTALGFAVSVTAAGTNTGSLTIQSISSAAAALPTPTVLAQQNLVTADLAAGSTFFIPIPPQRPGQRYIGLNYTVTG